MLSDIQPYHKVGHLCIDDIVKVVADYFQNDYIYMHTKGLCFTYSPKIKEGEEILSKLRTSNNYPTYLKDFTKELNYLKDFVGLDIEYVSDLTKEELVSLMRKNLSEAHPVAVISSTYYLPWHKQYYKKVSKLHTFLVTDMDDKTMLCVDGFISQESVRFEIEKLEDYTGILIFRAIKPQKEITLHNILTQIVQELEKNQKLKNSNSIREFAEDLRNITLLESEKDRYSDLDYSDFMVGLKSIEFSRKNMSEMFLRLAEKFGVFQEEIRDIQLEIESVSQHWKTVVVLFVKGFYSGKMNYYTNRIAEKLLEIAKFEENVTNKILTLKQKTEEYHNM